MPTVMQNDTATCDETMIQASDSHEKESLMESVKLVIDKEMFEVDIDACFFSSL